MDGGMDGRNEAAGRSILGSTICIQRGGILLMSRLGSFFPLFPPILYYLHYISALNTIEEGTVEQINKMASNAFH